MQSVELEAMIDYHPELRVRKMIVKVPALVTEMVCYERGQVTAMHVHPTQDEIWVIYAGRGEVTVGEDRLAVGPGSLIFIPAGARHGLRADADSRLVLLFLKSPGLTEGTVHIPVHAMAPDPQQGEPVYASGMRAWALPEMVEYDPELRVRKPIMKVPSLVAEIVCYEPGQQTATHLHPLQDEIWLVLEGRGEIWVDEERQPVQRGSVIHIPTGQRHGLQAAADSRLILLFIKCPGITDAALLAAGAAASAAVNTSAPIAGARLLLEVTDIQAEARDVLQIELRAAGGGELPPFEPGAHLPLGLPNGLLRHYSLANDWRERDRYVIGVGRTAQSKGGSLFVHQGLRRGMRLQTGLPKNGFALDPGAQQYLFLAGGIGITPILAMIRWCQAHARPWRLAYAVRSAQRGAFLETLQALQAQGGGQIHLHADDQMAQVFDAGPWLAGAPAGEHVYCCGPAPMMAAVKAAAAHRDPATVHFEFFAAPTDDVPVRANRPLRVELRRSGRTLEVPADRSILQVLQDHGVQVVSSCREGTCRTCETAVCEGAIEHRDYCLTPAEQEAGRTMMVCVSRALGEHLVLDL